MSFVCCLFWPLVIILCFSDSSEVLLNWYSLFFILTYFTLNIKTDTPLNRLNVLGAFWACEPCFGLPQVGSERVKTAPNGTGVEADAWRLTSYHVCPVRPPLFDSMPRRRLRAMLSAPSSSVPHQGRCTIRCGTWRDV